MTSIDVRALQGAARFLLCHHQPRMRLGLDPEQIRASCGGQRCAAAVAGPPGCRARWWKDVAKRRLVHAAPRHTHWDISMEICLIRHIGGLSQQAEDTWEKLKQGKLKH